MEQEKQSRADTDKRKVQEGDKRWLDNVCAELFLRVGEKAVAKMLIEKLDQLYNCHKLERRIANMEGKVASLEVKGGEPRKDLWELIEKINKDRDKVDEIRCEIDEEYKKIEGLFLDLEENLSSLEVKLGQKKL